MLGLQAGQAGAQRNSQLCMPRGMQAWRGFACRHATQHSKFRHATQTPSVMQVDPERQLGCKVCICARHSGMTCSARKARRGAAARRMDGMPAGQENANVPGPATHTHHGNHLPSSCPSSAYRKGLCTCMHAPPGKRTGGVADFARAAARGGDAHSDVVATRGVEGRVVGILHASAKRAARWHLLAIVMQVPRAAATPAAAAATPPARASPPARRRVREQACGCGFEAGKRGGVGPGG